MFAELLVDAAVEVLVEEQLVVVKEVPAASEDVAAEQASAIYK